MTTEQIQVILTSKLGDGCIVVRGKFSSAYATFSSINLDYLLFKQSLLGDLVESKLLTKSNNSGSFTNSKPIHSLRTKIFEELKSFVPLTLKECLQLLTDLGLALWFYDDGSLHKNKHFYNLNTHSFTEDEHDNVLIPYFASIGMEVRKRYDRKRDGRCYCYLYIPAKESRKINDILKRYPVKSLSYKTWSSETIPEGSRT